VKWASARIDLTGDMAIFTTTIALLPILRIQTRAEPTIIGALLRLCQLGRNAASLNSP
jgi:hypothetical protein